MDKIQEYLFQQMTEVIERKNQLELDLMIAEKDYQATKSAYEAYVKNRMKV